MEKLEIQYKPEDSGKMVLNSRGRKVPRRKYHLTEQELVRNRGRWEEDIKKVSSRLKKKAGSTFFLPYRKGVYYFQIKALFLLGSNSWHKLEKVLFKIEELMRADLNPKYGGISAWDIFKNRRYKTNPYRSKDYMGKIQENYIFLQRLSQLHPCGYKLKQVYSSIDIKRSSSDIFPMGVFSYKLNTSHKNEEEAYPTRDYSEFIFPKNENKYISYKFLGRTITKDKDIYMGIVQ